MTARRMIPRPTDGATRPARSTARTSRYGAGFDQIADRWAALEGEHDLAHPDRNDCGGVGGCPMMRRAHMLSEEMIDALDEWRTRR